MDRTKEFFSIVEATPSYHSTSSSNNQRTSNNKATALTTFETKLEQDKKKSAFSRAASEIAHDLQLCTIKVSQLTKLYGASAALTLDKELANLGITVDYTNK